jgi:hypothetical protein
MTTGLACTDGMTTGLSYSRGALACTGGGAAGTSKAGNVTGRPWTGGVHGASGAAPCAGKGGGTLEAGRRIGFGGGCAGMLDGPRVGTGRGAEGGVALTDSGATL